MDWLNERYVRVYTRDTVTWKMLDWRARVTMILMLRKADRAGVIDVGDHGIEGLSVLLELPFEIVDQGVRQLETRGVVVHARTSWVFPNFLEAQEVISASGGSSTERMRVHRERRRDTAKLQAIFSEHNVTSPASPASPVTFGDEKVTVSASVPPVPSVHGRILPSEVARAPRRAPRSPRSASSRSSEAVVGFADVIAEFQRRFGNAYGVKPTWGAKPGAQAKRLIKAHGHAEVLRRIEILFTEPPDWLTPPFDFSTLVQHFDKLATPSRAAPGRVPVHQQQMNRQLSRLELYEKMAKEPHDYDGDPRVHPTCRLCANPPTHALHPEASGSDAADQVPWS